MTREEILKDWTIVGIDRPKKGQFFLGSPNHNPNSDGYSVFQCEHTFNRVCCPILEKKIDVTNCLTTT